MIYSVCQRPDNLIEIRFKERSDYISCQILYSTDNTNWNTASIYPDMDSEFVLNGCDFLWSQAQDDGIVRLYGKDDNIVYWNYILNLPRYTGQIYIKSVCITENELYEDIQEFIIEDKGVIYLADWESYLGENGSNDPKEDEDKWHIVKSNPFDFVRMKYKKLLPAIRIPVSVNGNYDIYIGIKSGTPEFLIKIKDCNPERFICGGRSMSLYKSNYAGKINKEIYWKSYYFDNNSDCFIEIIQLEETIKSFHDMGSISYIKLVPALNNSRNWKESDNNCENILSYNKVMGKEKLYPGELILYYEPYSYTLHGFHDAESMNRVMLEEFIRMNPKEITCQTVRVGSKCLHHSKFLERVNRAARTDDNTIIDDPVKLANNCDILEESIKYIKGKGIRLTANIGMNRPYLWLPEISEKFVSENPHLLKGGYFDYTKEEVQEYALKIIYEIIDNYDIDGMFFDYMRSYNNQTVESLINTIKMTKERLKEKEQNTGKKLELKARIPADQIVYYQAMKVCVENEYIDGIVPSNIVTSEPLPPVKHYLELCKGTKTKVYGCIDGWKYTLGGDPRAGSLELTHTPKDIIKYFTHYENEGVNGIFIYQGDQISANPYINIMFK